MRSRKGGSPSLLLLRAFDTSPTLSSLLAFCGEEGERGKVFEVKGKRGEGKVKRLWPLPPPFLRDGTQRETGKETNLLRKERGVS